MIWDLSITLDKLRVTSEHKIVPRIYKHANIASLIQLLIGL